MKRAVFVIALMLGGCAGSHEPGDDAGSEDASQTIDASHGATGVDAGSGGSHSGPGGPQCGPNRCRTDEICCDDRCGICAFEGECPGYDCPGP